MIIGDLVNEGSKDSVACIEIDAPLTKVARRLLDDKIGALVVIDSDDVLVGIVSERDLVQVVANYDADAVQQPVESIMSRDVISCKPSDEIGNILKLMNANGIRHMPVLCDGKLAAMVSIRQLTKAYDILQVEANTDPLTSLSNRRSFLKRLDHEFTRARRFGHDMTVAMLDLDHFKSVNDTYGHDVGDEVLLRVSDLMISEFRTIDLVGRLGGEEFALIFPETKQDGAIVACERLRKRIEAEIFYADGVQFRVTASMGLARVAGNVQDGTMLLKRADELLYQAKHGGRNQVFVEDLPDTTSMRRIGRG